MKRHKIETFILCFIIAVTVIMFYLHHQLPYTDRAKYFPQTSLAVLQHKNPKILETVDNPKKLESVDNPKNLEPVDKKKTCNIDAECEHLETCLSGACVTFWPKPQANKSNCHRTCEQDLRLYENHFYLKNITDVSTFEGISDDTCVLTYRLSGNASGLSVTEYERWRRGAEVRVESISGNSASLVALCKTLTDNFI